MARARTTEAKDRRRQSLLTAALDEFFERGYAAARMDDIARRASLSKGAVYLYFDSKEALFSSLIEDFAVPNVERLETAVKSAGGGVSALHALIELAPVLIEQSPVPKIVKVLIADAPAFPAIVTTYRKTVIERVLGVISSALQRANSAGEIAIGDPRLTARLVVAPIIVSAIWRVVFEHDEDAKVDLPALLALHREMLLRAIAVNPGSAR